MISGSAVVGSMHRQFSSQYDVSVLMYELTYYIGLPQAELVFKGAHLLSDSTLLFKLAIPGRFFLYFRLFNTIDS